jgi:hypothetical protein
MPRSEALTRAEKRLAAAQDKARRRAMGKPLDWSEQDLDTLATVTPADAKSAEAHARRYGSKLLNELLGAEPVDDDG